MFRPTRRLLAAAIAIAAMLAATASAHATGTIANSTGTTVKTVRALTLRDSVLGALLANATMTITLRTGLIACDLVNGVTIGAVTAAGIVVTAPAPAPVTALNLPWPVTTRCQLTSGSLQLILRPTFSISFPIGTFTWTGTTTENLNPAGTAFTGTASLFNSTIPSVMTWPLPWTFATSPAVVWTLL